MLSDMLYHRAVMGREVDLHRHATFSFGLRRFWRMFGGR